MLCAGIFINRLGTVVEPFLGVYLVAVRRLPVAQAGLVMAVYAAGALVSQLAGSALTDRFGPRITVTAGMLTNAAALLAFGYATRTATIPITAFAAGMAIDLYRPAVQTLIADPDRGDPRTV